MARLSSATTEIKDRYQVVVVGSGYGGAIAASRFARAGVEVCVLERGKEIPVGDFPDTLDEFRKEIQLEGRRGRIGARSALYDFRLNEDINVFKGCGLGGTSLVNANVAIEAEDRVFDDRWPEPLRGNPGALAEGYALAREMLGSNPYPDAFPELKKLEAHRKSAEAIGAPFQKVDINVAFEDGPNHAGVPQHACTLCGDCVSGCNYGAKNTLTMNYLPDAKNWGAEIFTQVDVRFVEQRGDRWLVHYQQLDAGREAFDAPTQFVEADLVVISGGSLGSTEILKRSEKEGLDVSSRLGHGFSGNGDFLGFCYNADEEINGFGWGQRERTEVPNPDVGPCITSVIDVREQDDLDDGLIIQEGVIPGLLRIAVQPLMIAGAGTVGVDTDPGLADEMKEWARQTLSLATGGRHGAMRNTQTYLIMAHDGADGVMDLDGDRLAIRWPGVGSRPVFTRASDYLEQATAPLGGTYVKNPIWTELFEHDVVTVHPLGGCCMADSADEGVVNHLGQVFKGPEGDAVYENLVVCDGAIVPRSLGANPLLTISALAERNAALIAEANDWTIDYSRKAPPAEHAPPLRPGVRFTETMRGYVTVGAEDFEAGYETGEARETPFEFTLTIESDDVEAMVGDPAHRARMTGTAIAPSLSSEPLSVSEGDFQLFCEDPDRARVTQMRYRMKLTSQEGRAFSFYGYKEIVDDPGFDLWKDTTTLYITVDEIDGEEPLQAKGILRIPVRDFVKQIGTIRAINASGVRERLGAVAKFSKFFLGELFDSYGKFLIPSDVFDPAAPPRKRRQLRLPPAEVFRVQTDDGVTLRLTRHEAGGKGPVILAPGMGTSTQAFALDTVDVNLAEYLAAHGYDLWLFDYRASSALPTSRAQFSLDTMARYDYAAAIAKVREVTGAESVQVVAHCVASATLFMSLLGGHATHVRQFVSSQFTPVMETTPLIDVKSGLRLPALLQAFGVDILSTEFDTESSFAERAYDAALRLYPAQAGQLCDNPVCRRIRFMWGEVFLHDNLNQLTHDAVHEMFGDGNLTLFNHLATVVRAGKLVSAEGDDLYLPHLDRLKLPITILQGGENTLFLPSASEQAFEALVEANGAELYRRKVFDGYAHMDCFIGRDAYLDVFPYVLEELDRFN